MVGDTPLYEAAEHHPVDAWRVWTLDYPRDYTEDSEVCNAGHAEHQVHVVLPMQHVNVPRARSYACLLS